MAGKAGKAFDLVVVEAAQQHAVDLERSQPGGARGANAAQDCFEAARNARNALEGGSIHCVHADGDAIEPSGLERRGQVFEQVAVGGERQIERRPPAMVRMLASS